MTKHYDAIIIGGGHNGLVAAAYLAQAGQQALLLEKRDVLGGAATAEAIWPGFRVPTGAHDAGLFQDQIVQDLFLKMNGLEFRQSPVLLFAPQPDGRSLTLWRDVEKSQAEIGRFSSADAARYPAFVQQVNEMAAVLRAMVLQTPPDVTNVAVGELLAWGKVGLKLKRMGNKKMMDFLRVLPMPARDYLDEWFESDALKGALAADAITGSQYGPRAAGTTLLFLYQHLNGFGSWRTVLGGMGQLAESLASAARQNGATLRTGTGVAKIQVDENGRAIAVILENGDQLSARVILSSLDPRRTFFELLGPQKLEPRFMRPVRNYIYRGTTARLNLALRGLPEFVGQPAVDQLHGRILISPSLDYLEKAADAAKYGRFSLQPFLEIAIPSLTDPASAPAGQHLMSITVKYAPYSLRDGDWADQRDALTETILDTLAPYASGLRNLISDHHLLTPCDYEQEYGLTEGHIFHGQMSLDQLLVMRPVPGWSRYQTPIPNLYLCGAGAHPGGGVTGASGYNAAREALNQLK